MFERLVRHLCQDVESMRPEEMVALMLMIYFRKRAWDIEEVRPLFLHINSDIFIKSFLIPDLRIRQPAGPREAHCRSALQAAPHQRRDLRSVHR